MEKIFSTKAEEQKMSAWMQ